MTKYTLWLQESFKTLGYAPGPIDGINGPLTQKAIRAFQDDHGLLIDGIVGENTHKALLSRLRDVTLIPKQNRP